MIGIFSVYSDVFLFDYGIKLHKHTFLVEVRGPPNVDLSPYVWENILSIAVFVKQ